MDYGNILSRAWQIIWKHKILWIFGILAGCSQVGTSGGGNSGFRFSSREGTGEITRWFEQIDPNVVIVIAVVAVLVLLVVGLVVIFLNTIGSIGLVRGTLQAEGGSERLIFGELFSGSMTYFWRVLGLNILAGLALLILFPLVGVPIGICTCGIGFLAMGLFIPVFLEQASIAIVVENLGVFAALGRSWQIIRDHFGPMLVMALILGVGISLIAVFIIGLPILLAIGPVLAAISAWSMTGSEIAPTGAVIVAGLCFVAYIPLLFVLSGILRSFLTSAWTLTFLRLTGRQAVAEPTTVSTTV